MTEIIPYYVRGHTAEGMVNYVQSNLKGIDKVLVLKHDNKQFIADVLQLYKAQMENKSFIEIIYSPYLAHELEGIIDRKASLAIVASEVVISKTNVTNIIDLNEWIPMQDTDEMKGKADQLLQEAYRLMKDALTIHDQLERVYIGEMNFLKADKVADNLINELFEKVATRNKNGQIMERLFGTNTIGGTINNVEEIIEPIKHRIFVKGRAGTGKSVLLKKVLNKSLEKGYDVELYRCSFDPKSVDMVLIRDLNYCLFDSTAPHEFFPTRATDRIIDLYKDTVTSGTDEKYAKEISEITNAYKNKLQKGLANIHALHALSLVQPISIPENWYNQLMHSIFQRISYIIK